MRQKNKILGVKQRVDGGQAVEIQDGKGRILIVELPPEMKAEIDRIWRNSIGVIHVHPDQITIEQDNDWVPGDDCDLSRFRRPSACGGCRDYYGKVYGGDRLVCAVHPYGWDGEGACPDRRLHKSGSVDFDSPC